MLKLLLLGVTIVTVAAPIPASSFKSADFNFLKLLGKGTHANIYAVEHKKTHYLYAIKVMNVTKGHESTPHSGFNPSYAQSLVNELEISKTVLNGFEYAVRVYGAFVEGEFAFLLMDYVSGGSLLKRLREDMGLGQKLWDSTRRRYYYQSPLSDDQALQVLPRCLRLVQLLHGKKIIHRDLNLSNFLVTQHGTLILVDFTTARHFSKRIAIGRHIDSERTHQTNIDYARVAHEWYTDGAHVSDNYAHLMYFVMMNTDKKNVEALKRETFFKNVNWRAIDNNLYSDDTNDVNYAPHPFEPRARQVIEKDNELDLPFLTNQGSLRLMDKVTLRTFHAFNYESLEEPRAL